MSLFSKRIGSGNTESVSNRFSLKSKNAVNAQAAGDYIMRRVADGCVRNGGRSFTDTVSQSYVFRYAEFELNYGELGKKALEKAVDFLPYGVHAFEAPPEIRGDYTIRIEVSEEYSSSVFQSLNRTAFIHDGKRSQEFMQASKVFYQRLITTRKALLQQIGDYVYQYDYGIRNCFFVDETGVGCPEEFNIQFESLGMAKLSMKEQQYALAVALAEYLYEKTKRKHRFFLDLRDGPYESGATMVAEYKYILPPILEQW